ncbi:MAG: BON domain-containing protein [Steroidobacteraceae bacterium]
MKRRAKTSTASRTATTSKTSRAAPSAARRVPAARRASGNLRRADERISRAICERLSRPAEDRELADLANDHLDVSDVRVSVDGGRVTLEGTVPERRMKPYVEALVDACPGVQDIDNRLRVRR